MNLNGHFTLHSVFTTFEVQIYLFTLGQRHDDIYMDEKSLRAGQLVQSKVIVCQLVTAKML